MADVGINATSLSAPQGAGTQPVAPVQKQLDLGFVKDAMSIFASMGKDKTPEALTEYSKEVDKLNQGIETGQLSRAKALNEFHKLHSRFSAAHSELKDEFAKAGRNFKEFTAIGDAEKQVMEERQRVSQLIQSATAEGWYLPPGADEGDKEKVIAAHAKEVSNRKQLESFMKRVEFDRAGTKFNNEETDRQFKIEITQVMAGSTATTFEALDATANMLAKEVAANPAVQRDAQAKLSQVFAKQEAELQALAGRFPEMAGPYRSLLTGMKETFMSRLDPSKQSEADRKLAEDKLAELKANLQFMALNSSPSVKAGYATTTLLGPNVLQTLNSTAATTDIAVVFGAQAPGTLRPDGTPLPRAQELAPKDLRGFNKLIRESLKDSRLGKDAKFTEQATNLTKNYLTELGRLPESELTPNKLSAALETVADPAFGRFAAQGNLDPVQREGLKRVFNTAINQPMAKEIKTKLESATVPSGYLLNNEKGKVFVDIVGDVKFEGAGIKFVPSQTLQLNGAGKQQFKEETEQIEAAIGLAVRSAAHMAGHTDYQRAWEELRPQLMPSLYNSPTPLKVGQTVKAGEDTYEYIGGPDARQSSWRKVSKPKQ